MYLAIDRYRLPAAYSLFIKIFTWCEAVNTSILRLRTKSLPIFIEDVHKTDKSNAHVDEEQ